MKDFAVCRSRQGRVSLTAWSERQNYNATQPHKEVKKTRISFWVACVHQAKTISLIRMHCTNTVEIMAVLDYTENFHFLGNFIKFEKPSSIVKSINFSKENLLPNFCCGKVKIGQQNLGKKYLKVPKPKILMWKL